MRLIFIPGLGEEEDIFDKLYPLLPGDKIVLSFWKLLPNQKEANLNAQRFASQLVSQYSITKDDVVIGHSTGGWVAFFIKQLVGCRIVQIASWTDRRKVVSPLPNHHLIYFAVKTGLYLNKFTLRWTLKKDYQNKPSAPILERVFRRMQNGNKNNVVNQLRLIFNPVKEQPTVTPDLRIHALGDPIVRQPDEPFYKVPGDHFTLYTDPEKVAEPILKFLNSSS